MAGITGRNPYIGNYPAAYAPGMNGYQNGGYWPQYQQPQMMQPGPQQGGAAASPQMTLPTVHADILQVADEEAMEKQPVDAGTSQMMITRDETVIGVKSMLANGESTLDIYRKQPKKQKAAAPEYVTRAEFEKRLAEMMRIAAEEQRPPERVRPALRVVEPEEEEPEYEEPEPRTVQRTVQRTRSATGGKRG